MLQGFPEVPATTLLVMGFSCCSVTLLIPASVGQVCHCRSVADQLSAPQHELTLLLLFIQGENPMYCAFCANGNAELCHTGCKKHVTASFRLLQECSCFSGVLCGWATALPAPTHPAHAGTLRELLSPDCSPVCLQLSSC